MLEATQPIKNSYMQQVGFALLTPKYTTEFSHILVPAKYSMAVPNWSE